MGTMTQKRLDEILGIIVNNALSCYNPDGEWNEPSIVAKLAYKELATAACGAYNE